MKKILVIIIILINLSACSRKQEIIDLEKMPNDYSPSSFYRDKIKKTNTVLATDVNKVKQDKRTELLNDNLFIKDTLGYFNSEKRFPTKQYLSSINDWMSRKKTPTKIFGYRYLTVSFHNEDTLAILNTVPFPKIDMTENTKHKFMSLEVVKISESENDYLKVRAYFEKKCKKLNIKEFGTASRLEKSYWENKNNFFIFTKENKKQKKVIGFDEKAEAIYETVNVTDIGIEMFSKSFIMNMKKDSIYSSGNCFWLKE